MSIIKLSNVSKFYYNHKNISSGFSKINLELDMGEFVVITGESGSGKSTLLNVLSGLDTYEEGEMYINGEETSHYTEVDYENYRRKYIGNIFQHFNLINSYTVYQNIELVLLLNGAKKKDIDKKILDIIETVGLSKYKNTKTSKLSGGQKQRVAIARALAKDTPIILADEPTGNLDVKSAKSIIKLLSEIAKEKLVIIVTHNYEQVENYATRKISMHDGKIIEDKKIKPYEPAELKEINYKNITFTNKIRIGFRNVFNIKMKFILLFLVYFCLTLIVFGEYSSIQKTEYDSSLTGYNYYFEDTNTNRVILNKKDKTAFTKEELENLKNNLNIESLEKYDILLDNSYNEISDDNYFFYGALKPIKNELKLDMGVMPTKDNEVIVQIYNYYEEDELKNIIGKEYSLNGDTTQKYIITGIKFQEITYQYEPEIIYMRENALEHTISKILSQEETEVKINNKIYSTYNDNIQIKEDNKVPEGKIIIPESISYTCSYDYCINKNISIHYENIYYNTNLNLTVKSTYNKDNYKTVTSLDEFIDYSNVMLINPKDFDKIYKNDIYQTTVYLKDNQNSEETIKYLENSGYNTYHMKNLLFDMSSEMRGILNIIRNVIYIIATIGLFFISYFIIKIILKSRNIYFSTIRILGATKKGAKHLLNIELLIDVTISYLAFLIIICLVNTGVINIKYLSDMVSYFKIYDYILVYLILLLMSLLISNRFAQKLFKNSVMNTYREEV